MKKLLALLLTLLALTVVFAACSCGGDGETTETTDTAPATDPVTDPVTEPITEPETDPVTNPVTDPVDPDKIPLVADDQFVPVEGGEETVYAFPNKDGVYNKGERINYYSAPSISFPLEGKAFDKLYAGNFDDGTELKRVAIYATDEAKTIGWSKIAVDGGKFVYVRNSVLTTDKDYAAHAAETTETAAPKPKAEVVADDKFEARNETVYVFPRTDKNIYIKDGKISYYTAPAVNKDDRDDYYGGEYVDGKQLTRVGFYVENAEDAEQNGWSKIAIDGGKFVYIRNWLLTTDPDYKTKAKTN